MVLSRLKGTILALALAVGLAASSGCTLIARGGVALADHPKKVVAWPNAAGFAIGSLFAVPVYPLAACVSRDSATAERASFATATVPGMLVAAPTWILFGWWGAEPGEQPAEPDRASLKYLTRYGTYDGATYRGNATERER